MTKKFSDNKTIAILVGVISIVFIALIVIALLINRSDEVTDEPETPAVPTTTLLFATRDGKNAFEVTFDDTYTIDSYSKTSTNNYFQFSDNPEKGGSVDHKFTYFYDESAMTSYFQGIFQREYALTYPISEEAQALNELYLYYDTVDDVSTGMFYDWDADEKVKEYNAGLITNYYNSTPANNSDPYYKKESSFLGSSYCVINIAEIEGANELTGYLVIHGLASAGSEINYCKDVDALNTFQISFK